MYIYNADTYCDTDGEEIIANLTALGHADNGDSDFWPQQDFIDSESDHPVHCCANAVCGEKIDLYDYGLTSDDRLYGAEDRYVGAILSDSLTNYGRTYLNEMLAEEDPTPYQRALHKLWRETFDIPEDSNE